MTIIDIINKKRLNQTLTDEEIQFFVEEYTKFAKLDDKDSNKKIKDYQATSLLMSIVINGLNSEETFSLTKYMLHSGKIMDWSSVEGIKVDKHSTGGIGD
jgi:pyrimidine-nucleoside phosphorylase